MGEGVDYWSLADRLFPAPDNLVWDLLPPDKVVSGKCTNIS
jgi:hypothetical protein